MTFNNPPSTEWAPEHSNALRDLLASGLSYAHIARALNARFNTSYTRNAAIGRAARMGLVGPDRPAHVPKQTPPGREQRLRGRKYRAAVKSLFAMPRFKRDASVKLRCVEVEPRHLSLLELERGDCRYPYGGDVEGEAITFCGHPKLPGTSYCTPHFHLTRGPGTALDRTATPVLLRLVTAA